MYLEVKSQAAGKNPRKGASLPGPPAVHLRWLTMTAKGLLKTVLPPSTRRWLRAQQRRVERSLRRLRSHRNIGSLRRTTPV